MPSGSRHTLQVSRLASQPVLQWFRNVSADALDLRVNALEPERPKIQCFVSANLGKNMLSD